MDFIRTVFRYRNPNMVFSHDLLYLCKRQNNTIACICKSKTTINRKLFSYGKYLLLTIIRYIMLITFWYWVRELQLQYSGCCIYYLLRGILTGIKSSSLYFKTLWVITK